MSEHFDGLPQKHGASVAEYVHGLSSDNYITSVSPVEDENLEKAVMKHLNADGITEGKMVSDKVINPLHSSLVGYSLVELCGHIVAFSSFRYGYKYGKVVPEWVEEAGKFSSITLAA